MDILVYITLTGVWLNCCCATASASITESGWAASKRMAFFVTGLGVIYFFILEYNLQA